MLIVAPYYSEDVIRYILKNTRKHTAKKILLALSEQDVQARVQSVPAIGHLRQASSCEVRFIRKPDLHAKFIVADRKSAIVTSSNLTGKGLDSNIEMGIRFNDPTLAAELGKQFDSIWLHGEEISPEILEEFARLPKLPAKLRFGKSFGGTFSFDQKRESIAKRKLGWILIHSSKVFDGYDDTPLNMLKKRFKKEGSPVKWTWDRGGRGPMKEDGRQYTMLLAFEGKVFGRAKAKIKAVEKTKRDGGHPFAFMLSSFKPQKEVSIKALWSEKCRDLKILDGKILKRYN